MFQLAILVGLWKVVRGCRDSRTQAYSQKLIKRGYYGCSLSLLWLSQGGVVVLDFGEAFGLVLFDAAG